MNIASLGSAAWQLLGPLVLEISLVVGATTLVARLVRSAVWRRIAWRTGLVGIAFVLFCEATGLVRLARHRVATMRAISVESTENGSPISRPAQGAPADPIRLTEQFRRNVAERAAANQRKELRSESSAPAPKNSPEPLPKEDTTPQSSLDAPIPGAPGGGRASFVRESVPMPDFPPAAWLGLFWLTGTGVIALRICLGWATFVIFRWRNRLLYDAPLHERVGVLKARLGFHRTVRLMESRRLAGPVAFGVFTPAIALPKDFRRDFNSTQQDAMLAHELAHLASCDSAWQFLADVLAAALWWHPLVWWLRHQLLAATETAADEASLLVANGPNALAECLVALGGRLIQPRSLSWVSMAGNGFRSGLGRRVARLVALRSASWQPPSRLWSRLTMAIGPVGLSTFAIVGTVWAGAARNENGESMKTIQQTLQRSLFTLAFVSSIALEPDAPAQIRSNGTPDAAANSAPSQTTPSPGARGGLEPVLRARYGIEPPAAVRPPPPSNRDAVRSSASAENVRAKLAQTVLQEVLYDGIPLSEVLKDLSDEARKRDPDHLGLNFLISNAAPTKTEIDPLTGQPVALGPAVDLNNVLIHVSRSIRHVRLKDVLDVIVEVADHPIHYSIENYGVVFSAGPAAPDDPARPEEQQPLYRMDPALMRRYGLLPPSPGAEPPPMSETNRDVPNNDKARIQSVLDQTILSEVLYDGIPFSEVLKDLDDMTRKKDPEKRGINLIVKPAAPAPLIAPTTVFDPNGNPIAAPPAEPIDLNHVIVRFNLPLRNVRLRDVLDAITKVAEKPIRYSVENYGALFSLDDAGASVAPPASGPSGQPVFPYQRYGIPTPSARYGFAPGAPAQEILEVRTFRVDTNTITKGLESAFGITVESPSDAEAPVDAAKKQIELELAEKTFVEIRKRAEVGHATPLELERTRAAVDELKATNAQQRLAVRIRLADQELKAVSQQFETGRASSLDRDRAKAAKDILELELKSLEAGRSPANLSSEPARQGSNRSENPNQTNPSGNTQQALWRLFTQLGATLDPEVSDKNIGVNGEEGVANFPKKSVFYNAVTGIVMVRAAAGDMTIIQAAMETLGASSEPKFNRSVSIVGAVEKPGVIEIPIGVKMDILEAIAQAGGFGKTANKNKIELSRHGKTSVFKFDDLRKNTAPDKKIWLQPGDLIYVGVSVL